MRPDSRLRLIGSRPTRRAVSPSPSTATAAGVVIEHRGDSRGDRQWVLHSLLLLVENGCTVHPATGVGATWLWTWQSPMSGRPPGDSVADRRLPVGTRLGDHRSARGYCWQLAPGLDLLSPADRRDLQRSPLDGVRAPRQDQNGAPAAGKAHCREALDIIGPRRLRLVALVLTCTHFQRNELNGRIWGIAFGLRGSLSRHQGPAWRPSWNFVRLGSPNSLAGVWSGRWSSRLSGRIHAEPQSSSRPSAVGR